MADHHDLQPVLVVPPGLDMHLADERAGRVHEQHLASRRLVEVGARAGCGYAQLVQRAADIDWRALDGIRTLGLTAGASAPEFLVDEVIAAVKSRYDVTLEQVETAQENVEFKVPRVLRETA